MSTRKYELSYLKL